MAALTAAMAADGTDCLVLSQHGCVVMADSVELAHKRARNLEEAAALTYRALTLGRWTTSADAGGVPGPAGRAPPRISV